MHSMQLFFDYEEVVRWGAWRSVLATYTEGTAERTGGSTYCCVFKALNKSEKRSRATTRRWVVGAMLCFVGCCWLLKSLVTWHYASRVSRKRGKGEITRSSCTTFW
jgi:hypothetical protein